jgi:hypothetical protein
MSLHQKINEMGQVSAIKLTFKNGQEVIYDNIPFDSREIDNIELVYGDDSRMILNNVQYVHYDRNKKLISIDGEFNKSQENENRFTIDGKSSDEFIQDSVNEITSHLRLYGVNEFTEITNSDFLEWKEN